MLGGRSPPSSPAASVPSAAPLPAAKPAELPVSGSKASSSAGAMGIAAPPADSGAGDESVDAGEPTSPAVVAASARRNQAEGSEEKRLMQLCSSSGSLEDLHAVFPALSLDVDHEVCPHCHAPLTEDDIRAGMGAGESDFGLICPKCRGFGPRLAERVDALHCDAAAAEADLVAHGVPSARFAARFTVLWGEDSHDRHVVEVLSPWVLRRQCQRILAPRLAFEVAPADDDVPLHGRSELASLADRGLDHILASGAKADSATPKWRPRTALGAAFCSLASRSPAVFWGMVRYSSECGLSIRALSDAATAANLAEELEALDVLVVPIVDAADTAAMMRLASHLPVGKKWSCEFFVPRRLE